MFESKRGNLVLSIESDSFAESPRCWDNLGTIVCCCRCLLGDDHVYESKKEFLENINNNNSIILPIYFYDHSGLTIRTYPFSCQWDSGFLGYIYVSKEKVLDDFAVTEIDKELEKKVIKLLQGEIEIYNQFINGEVYTVKCEQIDNCPCCGSETFEIVFSEGGFYGSDWFKNGVSDLLIDNDCLSLLDNLKLK